MGEKSNGGNEAFQKKEKKKRKGWVKKVDFLGLLRHFFYEVIKRVEW